MKKVFFGLLLAAVWTFCGTAVYGASEVPEELQQLYARSAVLMDGDTSRVLF